MRRREFIAGLGGAVAWRHAARAQQRRIARVGFLGPTSYYGLQQWIDAFRAGLRELGYAEGDNLFIDFRWAEGRYERLPEIAAELARLKVDVIVTSTTAGALAAKQDTTTIPIVVAASSDPVATGVVTSLARPGGNITGLSFFGPELNTKRLELLKEAVPRGTRVGFLVYAGAPYNTAVLQMMGPTATALKMDLQTFPVHGPDELDGTFMEMIKNRVDMLACPEDALFVANSGRVAELAAKNGLPSIGGRELAQAGGLLGYGANQGDMFHRAAIFVDKILKGAKPSNLPVERATKFDLLINRRTANALGLTIPPTLLAIADEVIE
jgi:putative tryptophan/tyrosine transport system substrate-binding protein